MFSYYAGKAGCSDGGVAEGASVSRRPAAMSAAGKRKGALVVKHVVKREAEEAMETDKEAAAETVVIEESVKEEVVAPSGALQTDGQQIYIIQGRDLD